MNDQGSGAGVVRVMGALSIVAGLLIGLAAANRPHLGYLFLTGLLVLVGVGLRIEAAIRGVDAKEPRTSSQGVDHYR